MIDIRLVPALSVTIEDNEYIKCSLVTEGEDTMEIDIRRTEDAISNRE